MTEVEDIGLEAIGGQNTGSTYNVSDSSFYSNNLGLLTRPTRLYGIHASSPTRVTDHPDVAEPSSS